MVVGSQNEDDVHLVGVTKRRDYVVGEIEKKEAKW